LVKTKFHPFLNHHILQIGLHATLGSFQDSRLGLKVITVCPQKRFNRKQYQISQQYQKRISIYVFLSGKTAVASVDMQKGSSQVRFYTHTLQYRSFLILPHIIQVAPFHITDTITSEVTGLTPNINQSVKLTY
jgi:hypothetical protein